MVRFLDRRLEAEPFIAGDIIFYSLPNNFPQVLFEI